MTSGSLVFLLAAFSVGVLGDTDPIVVLESGSVRGTIEHSLSGRPLAAFYGIPYAKPPLGELRFKDPVPAEAWLGVINGTTPANPCLQFSHIGFEEYGSEDCLTVNVFTPKVNADGEKTSMDVLFYIHGGAFNFHMGRSRTSKEYGPKYLLDKDMVLVTFSYRLGPLGFLSTEDSVVPGNMGLKDQNLALQWVQKNIKSFGGNPNSVTIAGTSAGGASVHYHMLSPLSRGLFHKAISVSGSTFVPWAQAENLKEKTHALAASVGCDLETHELLVQCLRSRPAEDIVRFVQYQQSFQYVPISPWAPIVDSASERPFLPKNPVDIIMDGEAADLPWLTSFTDMEGLYPVADFVYDDALRAKLENNWNAIIPEMLEYHYTAPKEKHDEISQAVKEHYLGSTPPSSHDAIVKITKMASDRFFVVGIVEAALAHARKYSSPVYSYNFTVELSNSLAHALCHCTDKIGGACHGDDLGLVLDSIAPVLKTPSDLAMSKKFVELWSSFAATGVPTYEGVSSWPTVQSSQPNVAVVVISDGEPTISTADTEVEFWHSFHLNEKSLSTWDDAHKSK